MQLATRELERNHAAARVVLHDEVDREELDQESGRVTQRLLVESVHQRVPGAVRGRAGALRHALAEVGRHAAEGPLVDEAGLGARERHAIMLELDHRGGRLLAHQLDGSLVAEPVRALDGVEHVPAPVVLPHVAERRADATLGGHGVTAGRKELGDAGDRQAAGGEPERRAQARTARADHDHVVAVIDEGVVLQGAAPKATRSTQNTPAAASSPCAKRTMTIVSALLPAPWT